MEIAEVFIACKKKAHYSRELILQQPALVHVVSGEMRVVTAEHSYQFYAGDTILLPRNQLGRMSKLPLNGEPCIAISVLFRQERLRQYYTANGYNQKPEHSYVLKKFGTHLPLEKFGYLTGRSLTTFKRDFKKVFNATPQKWIIQKRLELAHYQLSKKKQKPTEIYLETGFENLSHFSFAFKKHFGYAPTEVV